MSSVAERAKYLLNTDFYKEPNFPERVAEVVLNPPAQDQYILRCPIVVPGYNVSVPADMEWCGDLIEESFKYQRDNVGVQQPYAYLTIRHGEVMSQTDDEFHVDGFSMKVPHIPEQNYVWANVRPTEFASFAIDVPSDFNPLRHNLQYLIQDSMPADVEIQTLTPNTIYAMDPYVPHRRPVFTRKVVRTFIRLSMAPIPIDDRNNHINPVFGDITSEYDGVSDFRDKLLRYPVK